MAEGKPVEISKAKGRPMLTWVGKRPLAHITAYPAQHVETYDPAGDAAGRGGETWQGWPQSYPKGGLLFHGDNKEVLAHLLANGFRGKVKLVYIDPPFDSGADYVRKVSLRGAAGTAKLDGESYALGEQIQYTDIWANDNYLQFMYERLLLLKELLTEDGSIYLHCDWHRIHLLRCLLDEVFGSENFRAEITREKCNPKNYTSAGFGNIHDNILFYSKGDAPRWNRLFQQHIADNLEENFPKVSASGRHYKTAPLHAPGLRSGETGRPWRNIPPPPGNHWRYVQATLAALDEAGLIEWSETGNPRKIIYADESKGVPIQDIWLGMKDGAGDYPTEKNESILNRIIKASSSPDDLVLDCFIGSGTTAAVAQKLGRRWIGCDINKGAIQTTMKRLMAVIEAQTKTQAAADAHPSLPYAADEEAGQVDDAAPAQLSFAAYRVNDYDLQIQHNEAVNLACEYMGIVRTRSDAFFDGMLGKRLVKIIPFGHPVTLLDLEEVRRELGARPDEDRDVALVCLGKELAVDAWLADWNQMRTRGDVPNKIEAIELRTDPRYGGFFAHQPADGRVTVERAEGKLHVRIDDFVSPSIVERLKTQAGVLAPAIDDWRAMVDSVMIDAAYDGQVFNVCLADVPEKKADLVAGAYTLDAPDGETTVAVKITDMLGEEVLKISRT
jgi:DNA modification methylase